MFTKTNVTSLFVKVVIGTKRSIRKRTNKHVRMLALTLLLCKCHRNKVRREERKEERERGGREEGTYLILSDNSDLQRYIPPSLSVSAGALTFGCTYRGRGVYVQCLLLFSTIYIFF